MTAFDWLCSVATLELTLDDMDEETYFEEEMKINALLEQLPEEEKQLASTIYYFWTMHEEGTMPEA